MEEGEEVKYCQPSFGCDCVEELDALKRKLAEIARLADVAGDSRDGMLYVDLLHSVHALATRAVTGG